MKIFTIQLKEQFPALDTQMNPRLVAYLPDNYPGVEENRKHPAILICPGGAYMDAVAREGEPIALDYVARGFAAFVLFYSCRPEVYPKAIREAACAMALIRRNAEEWNVDANHVAISGFSAGGHLAASLGVKWNRADLFEGLNLNITARETRPDAMVLCYAVLTGDDLNGNALSIEVLYGKTPDRITPEELKEQDLIHQVTAETPPAYFWHTANDPIVSVTGPLLMATEMHRNGVGFSMHIFPNGPHGLANCDTTTALKGTDMDSCRPYRAWIAQAADWLIETFQPCCL